MRTIDEQRTRREAVQQIRLFMNRFELGSELDIVGQFQAAEQELAAAERRRTELDRTRLAQTHPIDPLRDTLRRLSTEIENIRQAVGESQDSITEQRALRAEFITAKTKAERADQATKVLEGVRYQRCPECGTDISDSPNDEERCRLCGRAHAKDVTASPVELEALRRDLNDRIDEIADSIARRERELGRTMRQLKDAEQQKAVLDKQLQEELARYDSAFVESIRAVEREIATLVERIRSLRRLSKCPKRLTSLKRMRVLCKAESTGCALQSVMSEDACARPMRTLRQLPPSLNA